MSALIYTAVTAVALRGRRVVILGHDSMGMETAVAHIIPTQYLRAGNNQVGHDTVGG
ncbi:MAG: hypothetical protein ACE5DO_04295 [Desulfobacterales bacterium]